MNHVLSAEKIEEILRPYLVGSGPMPPKIYRQLAQYLDLLMKWNARTNLTAVRDSEEIVRRHFGESLFAGYHLTLVAGKCNTALDFGSGAGFPGLPIQLLRPDLRVTLAESQNKKVTFLREVVRTLQLDSEIWARRVEDMPPQRLFDVVMMRAVDHIDLAIVEAAARAISRVIMLTTDRHGLRVPEGFDTEAIIAMQGAERQNVLILKRL